MKFPDNQVMCTHLSNIKRLCIFLFPVFFGFTLLQLVCNTSIPIAVSQGQSMEPIIKEGDVLIFQGIPVEDIQIGDVIIFDVPIEMNGLLPPKITHRVIDVITDDRGIFFRTKGDNAPPDTYEIPASHVHGVNIASLPYLGLFFLYIQSPLGLCVILATIFFLRTRSDY